MQSQMNDSLSPVNSQVLNSFEVGLQGDDVKMMAVSKFDGISDSELSDGTVNSYHRSWDNNSLSFDWYRKTYVPFVEKYYYPSYPTITYHTVEKEDTFKKIIYNC